MAVADPQETLHSYLRSARGSMMWKLDGLSAYDVRRPLTPTGTNLLGLVKHLSIVEVWYFGTAFDRSFPEHLPWWTTTRRSRPTAPGSSRRPPEPLGQSDRLRSCP